MSNGKWNLVTILSVGGIGFVLMQSPSPYSDLGMVLLFLGFGLLIFIGHKAAFRAHPLGILGQYSEPGKVLGAKLNTLEKRVLLASVTLILSILISFAIKVKWGSIIAL